MRRIAEFAGGQHGVVSHEQLLETGFSTSAIQRLVAYGQLHVVFRGVYAVGHPLLPPLGRMRAAVLACGPGALISHRSAGSLHRVLDTARLIVDVVGVANRRRRAGIQFHRVRRLHPDDCTTIDGLPVTSLARTLLDLAEVVPQRKLMYALEQADRQNRLDLRAIDELLARSHGRRGLKPLRAALLALDPEARYANAGLERDFLEFLHERKLPIPALNVVVEGFTVDALWGEQKVIVELDSWLHHRSKRAFNEDRRRDAKLRLAGYEPPLRVTHDWLTQEPDDLEKTLRTLLSAPLWLAATA